MARGIKARSYKPEAGETVAHEKGESVAVEGAEHAKKTRGKGFDSARGPKSVKLAASKRKG